jgi:hypothetical protein
VATHPTPVRTTRLVTYDNCSLPHTHTPSTTTTSSHTPIATRAAAQFNAVSWESGGGKWIPGCGCIVSRSTPTKTGGAHRPLVYHWCTTQPLTSTMSTQKLSTLQKSKSQVHRQEGSRCITGVSVASNTRTQRATVATISRPRFDLGNTAISAAHYTKEAAVSEVWVRYSSCTFLLSAKKGWMYV